MRRSYARRPDNRPMKACAVAAGLVLACVTAACAPALDWREVRPESSGLVALFPCKPFGNARQLRLVGATVEMTLYSCTAAGTTYAVAFADVGQPHLVGRALQELATAAASNIGASAAHATTPLRIEGMTPNTHAGRSVLAGQLGDGRRVEEQVAVFSRGLRVFQATVVGAQLDSDAVETFFGALRLPA